MKKLISILLVIALVAGFAFAQGGAEEKKADTIESKVEAGQKMTDAQLLELAKAETGDFYAYGNSSRIANAMKGFIGKYGAELGLNENNAVGSKMNDSEIYSAITQEATGGSAKVASVVMIQDGAQLVMFRSASDTFLNYVPGALASVIEEGDLVPLVHQYINKLFIWNVLGHDHGGKDLECFHADIISQQNSVVITSVYPFTVTKVTKGSDMNAANLR